MDGGCQHLSVGRGLDIVLSGGDGLCGSPVAEIHIRGDGADDVGFGDAAVTVFLSVGRLRALLGTLPVVDELVSRAATRDGSRLAVRNPALVRRIAQDIRRSTYKGNVLKLFLQAKVIELLVESLSSAKAEGEGSHAFAIRDLLLADPVNPPSMVELSRLLGVSQRRLSASFKEAFGMTVPDWLADWRLTRGRELLMGDSRPVAEIAASLGYAHLSTFTAAFTRKFGLPPTRMRSAPAAH